MDSLSIFDHADIMVLASVMLAVMLGVMLVIVIFTVKFKSQHEKIEQLKIALEEKIEKIKLLEESLSEVRILNASQLQELGQQESIQSKLKEEIDILDKKLQESNEKVEHLSMEIVSLEKDKSELGANVHNTKESIVKLEDALENATKRNEFWVEQMTEVRTKYEALKLKVDRG